MTTAVLGTAEFLVSGSITLTAIPGDKYWFFQNKSILSAIDISIPGKTGSVRLDVCQSAGLSGGWIDRNTFPFDPVSFTLTSVGNADPTAQFCAWSSPSPPAIQSQVRAVLNW